MKKLVLVFAVLSIVVMSCSRSISPYGAAHGKAGKCSSKSLR